MNFKKEKIYHGKGHVKKKDGLYRIVSNKRVILKNGRSVPFSVIVDVEPGSYNMPRSHKDLMYFFVKSDR
jgi:hypothetical protein